MVTYQKFNKRIKSWVKLREVKGKTKIINVKQQNPTKKFKGVSVRK
jgi:hypothetical protein